MSTSPSSCSFTAAERELIRHAFGMHFGSFPGLEDGIFLRTWRTGTRKGQIKLPVAVQSLLDRRLLEIRRDGSWPRAVFTDVGRRELAALITSPRFLPPDLAAHLREELGP